MKINVLPESVFNLLAAGEVVENPAAIVKELVENSVDAGAGKIEIEIFRGGLDKIIVSDNGCGVPKTEVDKVFMPHATSKIQNEKDLENISTLGFRGEAMPSIAAVAQVEFITKSDGEIGTNLHIEGGKTVSKKPVSVNGGTMVTVSNLFYNTPARAKFLRSANAEKNAVTNVVQRLIFTNPKVTVKYCVDGDIVYDFRGKTLREAINAVYGDDTADKILYVGKKSDKMQICGYIGKPTYSKRNRTYQTVIINNRAAEAETVSDAVNAAFSNFMTVGNFPFFVLDLHVDLTEVDVNVHPRKSLVKFSDNQKIYDFVFGAVSETLDKYLHAQYTSPEFAAKNDEEFLKRISFFQSDNSNTEVKSADHILNKYDLEEMPIVPRSTSQEEIKDLPKYCVIGTAFSTYILLEDKESFHIVDQHAAHERILYDKLSAQIDKNRVECQRLLDPGILMLSSAEMTKMEAAAETLNACGIECAPFGTNCFRITAVPVIVSVNGVDAMLDAILCDIKNTSGVKLSTLLREKIIRQCCRSAVKAGQNLDIAEIKHLVDDILKDGKTLTCPHGRPVMISYSKTQIEKMFARI